MASPVISKYERILQTDPRSRIFVELARALLDEGDAARAAEVCERGLVHHPDSVQARLTLGRALLALGRVDDAVQRFEEALAADASSPYPCDLAAEALLRHGHAARALPLLERAVERHPADPRIERRLDEARRAAPTAEVTAPPGAAPLAEANVARASTDEGSGDARDPLGEECDLVTIDEDLGESTLPITPDTTTPAGGPPPLPAGAARRPERRESGEVSPALVDPRAGPAGPPGSPPQAAPVSTHAAGPTADATGAAAAAQTYEQELRQRIQPAARSSPRLRRILFALLVVVAVPLLTWAALRLASRGDGSAEAQAALDGARNGLARDTRGSLGEAARVLARAAKSGPAAAAARELSAEISALLAHDFGDEEARGVAQRLLASGDAGPAAPVVRWLIAGDDRERTGAEAPLLAGAAGAPPLADAIGGEILLARGDLDQARRRLEAAARAAPPMLRAIAGLGDLELVRGDAAAARDRYALVLRAQPAHPQAAIGAAEAGLQLGGDLAESLRLLEAIDREPATVRAADRLRLDVTMARLLAASDRVADAQRRITAAAQRSPGRPEISAAASEVSARAGNLEEALRAAEVARRLAPGDPRYQVLAARTQLRAGHHRELLAESEGTSDRALRVYRAIALLRLGRPEAARAELEATRRDGKMTTEAAGWMAMAELALGHADQASTITAAVLGSAAPPAVALLVRGRLALLAGERDAAEQRLREALLRDPELVEARRDLGRLLLESGRAQEARELLERHAAQRPWDADLRLVLARARLAAGDAAGATQDLQAVLAARSSDVDALTVLSSAQLALGDPREAWRSAERAYSLAPRSAAVALALARAAQAQGDQATARRLFGRAARLGGDGPDGREARNALASMKRG